MAPPRQRVNCCSYNGNLYSKQNGDISCWLNPTSNEKDSEDIAGPVDFVAVGFQEVVKLQESLVGLTTKVAQDHAKIIRDCLETSTKSKYTLLSTTSMGGLLLLVFCLDELASSIESVSTTTAGVGIFGVMGNKGACGSRITTKDGLIFTFVTAHLAAHDHGLLRRNQDYQNLVERLVFTSTAGEYSQIYDTSYLFFFGDLNYRISTIIPSVIPVTQLAHKIINEMPTLLLHDQLSQEKSGGRTLHHLLESPITFRPTYKYKPGTLSEFKKFTKRVPGWCDRVLYATWADGANGAGFIKKFSKKNRDSEEGNGKLVEKKRKGVKVERYDSVMEFKGSDHKPVMALFSLPRLPKSTTPLRLIQESPFKINSSWKRKLLLGKLIDRFVGFFWFILYTAGLKKNSGLGVINLVLLGFAIKYYGII